MKFKDIRVGQIVYDAWVDPWRPLKVVKRLKTRIKVRPFRNDIITYDKAHCKFLRKYADK